GYRIRRPEIGTGDDRLHLPPRLIAEPAKCPDRIIAADDEGLGRPLSVPERRPNGESHPGLGIGSHDAHALLAWTGQQLPGLRVDHLFDFGLPLGAVQLEDAVRVLLADDTLLSDRRPDRNRERRQQQRRDERPDDWTGILRSQGETPPGRGSWPLRRDGWHCA